MKAAPALQLATGLALALVVLVTARAGPALVASEATGGASNATADRRVKLGVYMESLCPDSKRFFVNQLVPAYRLLGAILAPDIVAFGHARTLGNNRMVCQHGQAECQGNRQMACVQARAHDMGQQIETIGCLFRARESPQQCLAAHMPAASFEDVANCTSSSESYHLMLEAEKRTGRLGYVPHLTIDGRSGDQIQQEAEFDLKNTICNHFSGPKPDQCRSA